MPCSSSRRIRTAPSAVFSVICVLLAAATLAALSMTLVWSLPAESGIVPPIAIWISLFPGALASCAHLGVLAFALRVRSGSDLHLAPQEQTPLATRVAIAAACWATVTALLLGGPVANGNQRYRELEVAARAGNIEELTTLKVTASGNSLARGWPEVGWRVVLRNLSEGSWQQRTAALQELVKRVLFVSLAPFMYVFAAGWLRRGPTRLFAQLLLLAGLFTGEIALWTGMAAWTWPPWLKVAFQCACLAYIGMLPDSAPPMRRRWARPRLSLVKQWAAFLADPARRLAARIDNSTANGHAARHTRPAGKNAAFYLALAQATATLLGLAGAATVAYFAYRAEQTSRLDLQLLERRTELARTARDLAASQTEDYANVSDHAVWKGIKAGRDYERRLPLARQVGLILQYPEDSVEVFGQIAKYDFVGRASLEARLYLWLVEYSRQRLSTPSGYLLREQPALFPYRADGLGFEEWRRDFGLLYDIFANLLPTGDINAASLGDYSKALSRSARLAPTVDAMVTAAQMRDRELRSAMETIRAGLVEVDELSAQLSIIEQSGVPASALAVGAATALLCLIVGVAWPLFASLETDRLMPLIMMLASFALLATTVRSLVPLSGTGAPPSQYNCARWFYPLGELTTEYLRQTGDGAGPDVLALADVRSDMRGLVDPSIDALLEALLFEADVIDEALEDLEPVVDQFLAADADLASLRAVGRESGSLKPIEFGSLAAGSLEGLDDAGEDFAYVSRSRGRAMREFFRTRRLANEADWELVRQRMRALSVRLASEQSSETYRLSRSRAVGWGRDLLAHLERTVQRECVGFHDPLTGESRLLPDTVGSGYFVIE